MRQVRPAAVSALANAAHNLIKTSVIRRDYIVNLLIQLLRDSDKSVRQAAIGGLVLLKAKNAAHVISQVKHTLSYQDSFWVTDQVNHLNSQPSHGTNQLKQLKQKVNKLEIKINQLGTQYSKTIHELKEQQHVQQVQQNEALETVLDTNETKWRHATKCMMFGILVAIGINRFAALQNK